MNNVELMLRAVLDNPDDDIARLVYADALSERGDREMRDSDRAEYIRLAIRINKGDYSQGDLKRFKEIPENQENACWYHPFDNKNLFYSYRWHRGFIDHIGVALPRYLPSTAADSLRQAAKLHPFNVVEIGPSQSTLSWVCCYLDEDALRISSSVPWALRYYLNSHCAEPVVHRGGTKRAFQIFLYRDPFFAKTDLARALVAYAHAPRVDPNLVSKELEIVNL